MPDLDAAKTFYGAVFGWTFTDFYTGFAICQGPDGAMLGGLDQVDRQPPAATSGSTCRRRTSRLRSTG